MEEEEVKGEKRGEEGKSWAGKNLWRQPQEVYGYEDTPHPISPRTRRRKISFTLMYKIRGSTLTGLIILNSCSKMAGGQEQNISYLKIYAKKSLCRCSKNAANPINCVEM